ncbi:MAG: hypothetical protein RL235_310 [Chlamydiota bacterium]
MFHALFTPLWEVFSTPPFSEMIVSWNAPRLEKGGYHFAVSALTGNEWSAWVPYADWLSQGQSGYKVDAGSIKVDQDVISVREGNGFRIRVLGAAFAPDWAELHVYTNAKEVRLSEGACSLYQAPLAVQGRSQMCVAHLRAKDLCSPTSTAAVIQFLSPGVHLNTAQFADCVRDQTFDIFGNWVLNVAEASARLGSTWACWVERLDGLDAVAKILQQKIPVVVSIRGPLAGSALPYASGHLLVISGIDFDRQLVYCMDPAFSKDATTIVAYPLGDFVQAWDRRNRLAYRFSKR